MATILLVDDDPDFLVYTAERLKRGGHAVVVAADGCLALGVLERQPVDLVITDIYMPNKDGIELAADMHVRFPRTPLIALSGHLRLLESIRCVLQTYGAEILLQKPLPAGQLEAAVGSALAPRAAPDETPAALRG